MISNQFRVSTGVFVLAFVTGVLLSIILAIPTNQAVARDKELKPCILPGDGDGVGGYKDFGVTELPSGECFVNRIDVDGKRLGDPSIRLWKHPSPWVKNFCFFFK
jgi:hypothetical protein